MVLPSSTPESLAFSGSGAHDSLVFDAVGAFVALQRPGRADAEQVDALAMPLYGRLSADGRRRIAAVLSEARGAVPERLAEALALEPLAISASLLISRAALPDELLLRVMAARGAEHARVIGLRNALSETIRLRVDALVETLAPMTTVKQTLPVRSGGAMPAAATDGDDVEPLAAARLDAEETRAALRRLMMHQTVKPDLAARMVVQAGTEANLVARLINLALTGDADLLATAIADALRVPFAPVRRLVRRRDTAACMLLLKGLELGPTDCFAILAAMRPLAFATPEAIASYYVAFQSADDAKVGALLDELTLNAAGPDRRSA